MRGATTAALLVIALGAAAFQVWNTRPDSEELSPMAAASPLLDLDPSPEPAAAQPTTQPIAAQSMPQTGEVIVPDHDREQAAMAAHGG